MGGVRGKRRAMDSLHLFRKKGCECFRIQMSLVLWWNVCVFVYIYIYIYTYVRIYIYSLVTPSLSPGLPPYATYVFGVDEFERERLLAVSTVLVLVGNKLQLSLLIRLYFLYALKRSWTQLLVDRTFLSFLRVLAPCSRWAFGFVFTCVARVHWTAFNKQRFVICPSETVSCLSWSVLYCQL